jgi:hypothetical protein
MTSGSIEVKENGESHPRFRVRRPKHLVRPHSKDGKAPPNRLALGAPPRLRAG